MNKRFIVLIFFFASAIADIVSTFWRKGMLVLETNPLRDHIWLMLCLKIGIIIFIGWLYYRPRETLSLQYFYVVVVLLLTVVQFYAAYNNTQILKELSDVPDVELTEFALEPKDVTAGYYKTMFFGVYWPLIVNLLSFELWRWSYNVKKHHLR